MAALMSLSRWGPGRQVEGDRQRQGARAPGCFIQLHSASGQKWADTSRRIIRIRILIITMMMIIYNNYIIIIIIIIIVCDAANRERELRLGILPSESESEARRRWCHWNAPPCMRV